MIEFIYREEPEERALFDYKRGIAQVYLDPPSGPVHLVFDQIRPERRSGDVAAELLIYGGENGSTRQLHRTRLNLTSTRAREDTAKHLSARLQGLDWSALLEQSCWKVVDAQRSGRPSIRLRDAKEPPGGAVLLPPLLVPRDATIIFGDGGSCKSYLALAAGLSLESGRQIVANLKPTAQVNVAYLDFEWHDWDHKQRAIALWGGDDFPIEYIPCQIEGPLCQQVDRLRSILHEKEIQYVIVDSVALACDGPPEDAEVALRFFNGLARLEVGSLLLAHVTKVVDTEKPFGSAFWHNSARLTWFVQRVQEEETDSLDLALLNRKVNNGRKAAPFGLHFQFGNRTVITPADLSSVPELAASLTMKQRIIAELRDGAKTFAELAAALNCAENTIRQTVRRDAGKAFTTLPGNPQRVGRAA